MKQNKSNGIDDYVRRLVTPIFAKVLKEASPNPMMVGKGGYSRVKNVYYFPHNYRLYIDFNRRNFRPEQFIKTEVKRSVVTTYKINNSTELEFLELYNGCKITVKKTQVEIINKVEPNRGYVISLSEQAEGQIRSIVSKKDDECKQALREFMKVWGGSSEFIILNRHSENKIEGEDSIDMIPLKMQWHDKISKKVYMKRLAELSTPAGAANYIMTRSVENISPTIAAALRTVNPLRAIKQGVKKLSDVFDFKDYVRLLSESERVELENWLFKLGVKQ